ncbi:hypothetical protein [Halorussus marinus]|uniref:hypothetical protein n=1 Tax=Halorussus marinus TaxID=2505976 RepID=UPI00106EC871|nr:hypothetical protein [Halorussus marinus]
MADYRQNYRFLSSLAAFFVVSVPLFWYFLGAIAVLRPRWWLAIALGCSVLVGLLYTRRSYSLSRLWDLAWRVWKGLLVASVVFSVVAGLLFDVRLRHLITPTNVSGRIFFGGLGFVLFVVVYGASYQHSYLE